MSNLFALFRPSRIPSFAALVLVTSCGGCPPGGLVGPTDAGPADAGRIVDEDGGVFADAGETLDDGGAADGGLLDAGSDADAGEDAGGISDAGVTDAGGDAGPAADGGENLDGGGGDAGVDGGPGPDAGVACTSDADCAPLVCRLESTGDGVSLEGRCEAEGPGTRSRGDGCLEDDACANGLCLNRLCSGPCDDDSACFVNQVCGSRIVTVDGVSAAADVCLRGPLEDVVCEDNDACAATGRICRDLEPVDGGGSAIFCGLPLPGDGEIGSPCSGNFIEEFDFCRTGLCDDADVGEGNCTAACNDDGDCASGGAAWTCTGSGVGGLDSRLCGEECVRESDCGAGRSCTRRRDFVDNRSEFICDGIRGASVTGDTVTNGNECETGLARVDGTTSLRYCTEFCVDDIDCPNAMTCSAVSVTFPDGTGTQELLLCAQ